MLATLSYLGRQITQLLYNRMPTSQDNSNVDHSCAANHQLPFIVPFKGRADPSSGAPDGIQNDSRCNCIATISVPPYAHHPNMHCGGQPADNVFFPIRPSSSIRDATPDNLRTLQLCALKQATLHLKAHQLEDAGVCPGSKYFKASFFTN